MGIDDNPNVPVVGFNRALDFCVWVLQKDGLQVLPFDRHHDGDGTLRALGLDSLLWKEWMQAVAAGLGERVLYQREAEEQTRILSEEMQHRVESYVESVRGQSLGLFRSLFYFIKQFVHVVWIVRREPKVPFPQPVSLWPGSEELRRQLDTMFSYYRKHRRSPRRRYWDAQRVSEYLISPRFVAFERELQSLGERVGHPILVCFVNYPGPVIYPVSDSVVVIGVKNWDVDGTEFERVVDEAIQQAFGLNR